MNLQVQVVSQISRNRVEDAVTLLLEIGRSTLS